MNNTLSHTGTPQPYEGSPTGSGRYRLGSGDKPNQHSTETLTQIYNRLRNDGMTEVEAAKTLGYSTGALRDAISLEKQKAKAALRSKVYRMKRHGYSAESIASELNIPERTVYNWLSENEEIRSNKTNAVADSLKLIVDHKGYVDVGSGAEYLLDTNPSNLKKALAKLEQDGYSVLTVKTKNATDSSKFTNVKVLCKPGTDWGYIQNHQNLIQSITEYSNDFGKTLTKVQYPSSIDSNRVAIRYAEDGGKDYDGVMLIRRGVEDLSLGKSNYAQVRIAVDGTHYLKGMAIYADDKDLPAGVDILFNTNKTKDVPKMKVLKPLKDSEDLPFGAVVPAKGQSYYADPNGKYIKEGSNYSLATAKTPLDIPRYSLSPINKLKEEGEWNEYSKTLSSQMLSKQGYSLIKKQLDLTYAEKKQEFEDIKLITQPEVKKKMLLEFASECDKGAVDLKATALPGQTNKVILPLTCIKDEHIYAPGYPNGTKVALIRYPHAGLFEIPVLTVNNNNREARRILGTTPIDAVGITSAVASKLSGADFDGDTVVVIPFSDKVQIKSQDPLFKNFDPSEAFPGYPGMKVMTSREKGIQMGLVSNLITDMTLQGATNAELERAVKHSMVVIDAQKHELNWKLSEEFYGIAALKKEYQKKPNGRSGGSSTLISKASSETQVLERKQFSVYQDVDKNTGKVTRRNTDREYYQTNAKDPETGKSRTMAVYEDADGYFYYQKNKDGSRTRIIVPEEKVRSVKATEKSSKMMETDDAFTLSSGTKKEAAYAEFANSLKALANESRKEYFAVESAKVEPSIKKAYEKEIESLKTKIENASLNAPKERQAQLIANQKIKELLKVSDPDEEELKKAKQNAITQARAQVGADKKSVQIHVTDSEWQAMVNGALSSNIVNKIITNMDSEELKERAMPRTSLEISDSKKSLIRTRAKAGFTIDEIARSLGLSTNTVSKYIKEE